MLFFDTSPVSLAREFGVRRPGAGGVSESPPAGYARVDLATVAALFDSIGLTVVEEAGDGNCLFRALARQGLGNSELHVDVRRQICDLIAASPALLRALCDGVDAAAYVAVMRDGGTYGTIVEVVYAQVLFKRPIFVYDLNAALAGSDLNTYPFLCALQFDQISAAEWTLLLTASGAPIGLAWSARGNHYNSVLPVPYGLVAELAAMKVAPSGTVVVFPCMVWGASVVILLVQCSPCVRSASVAGRFPCSPQYRFGSL